MKRSQMDAALEELDARVPDVACKVLCHQACGPIGMNPREGQRIRERGVNTPHHIDGLAELVVTGDYTCPALNADNQCSVYEVRPMLCRLWGATEGMPCEYGCTPADAELMA
jgi:Fe-S-cluster containining protein